MKRSQAITFSIILSFVLLGLVGVLVALLLPYDELLPLAQTATPPPTPTVTPTPTVQVYLPPAGTATATPGPPTPTNTRLPTFTPAPQATATPTLAIELPKPQVRPTNTLPPLPELPTPTPGPSPTPLPQLGYSVSFTADDARLERGDCTQIRWEVSGPVQVRFEGEAVAAVGEERVCPNRSTSYMLETQIEGNAEIRRHQLRITVE